MITTGYKTVKQDKTSIFAGAKICVQYKLNSWVCPSIKDSLLFGYTNCGEALDSVIGTERVYECEFFDAIRPDLREWHPLPYVWLHQNRSITVFWDKFDCKIYDCGGVVLAKAIRLRKLI